MAATREPPRYVYTDRVSDSSRWNEFIPRKGDIVVSSPPKSGTTWVQGILALLISGDPKVDAQLSTKSPWIDFTPSGGIDDIISQLEAQVTRRHVKTHSPFDCIPYWPQIRYITVYRHPIDVHFSSMKHIANIGRNEGLQLPKISDSPSHNFRNFLSNDRDLLGLPHLINHYRSTLAREPRENLMRLHYLDMVKDLWGTFAWISAHVGIEHPPELTEQLIEAATFENMKMNAGRFAPSAGQQFWKSDSGFFDSGTSNKWEGKLNEDDLEAYDTAISAHLTLKELSWLEWGNSGRKT